jgi:RNA polymerase sigma-70 factor (ECF subfamily)
MTFSIDFPVESAAIWANLDGARHRLRSTSTVRCMTPRQAMKSAVGGDADAGLAGRWSDLMAAAQAGDRGSYDRLLRECVPVIRGVARRQGVPPAYIDDVIQEVLLSVHRARQTYDPARPFLAWLAIITQRRAIDVLRQHGRRERREVYAPTAYEAHADPDSNPAKRWESNGQTRALGAAITDLPSSQREAVERLALQELSLAEASAVTGRTEGALKVSLHRALKTLLSSLRATEVDND